MSSPLENPMVRYGIGLSGAVMVVLVAVLFLEGVTRYVAFGIAALDAVVVPKVLEMAVEGDAQAA